MGVSFCPFALLKRGGGMEHPISVLELILVGKVEGRGKEGGREGGGGREGRTELSLAQGISQH